MLLAQDKQRAQGFKTVSKYRHCLDMLKGDDRVLRFLLSKNGTWYKEHRESWSQITPPHNLAAPHNLGFSFTVDEFGP